MDRRDDLTWIAIELTHYGERLVEDGQLTEYLRRDLDVDPDFPIFIPSTTYKKNGKVVTIHLMEGYAFAASGLPETCYFALESKSYVSTVISSSPGPHQIRVLSVLPNREVENLRKQLHDQQASDIEEGAWVTVVRGKFRGLAGRVMALFGDGQAYVEFRLRSLIRISPLPKVFLEVTEKPDESEEDEVE